MSRCAAHPDERFEAWSACDVCCNTTNLARRPPLEDWAVPVAGCSCRLCIPPDACQRRIGVRLARMRSSGLLSGQEAARLALAANLTLDRFASG